MVAVQQQQAGAFEALAAATEQQKYNTLFAAVPKYDGKNKEDCATWIIRIPALAILTGRNLRMELLNRSEGSVITMLSTMNEEVSDEDLKEELMRCFSNAPTMVQAISLLRGIKQRQGENARLYAARYEVVHDSKSGHPGGASPDERDDLLCWDIAARSEEDVEEIGLQQPPLEPKGSI